MDTAIKDQNKQQSQQVYLFTNNKLLLLSKFIAVFVPHPPAAPGTCKQVVKS